MLDGNWKRGTERVWNKVHNLLELLIYQAKSDVLQQENTTTGQNPRGTGQKKSRAQTKSLAGREEIVAENGGEHGQGQGCWRMTARQP